MAAQIDNLNPQLLNTPSNARNRRDSDNISKQLKRLLSRCKGILDIVNAAIDRNKKISGTVSYLQSVSRGLRSGNRPRSIDPAAESK